MPIPSMLPSVISNGPGYRSSRISDSFSCRDRALTANARFKVINLRLGAVVCSSFSGPLLVSLSSVLTSHGSRVMRCHLDVPPDAPRQTYQSPIRPARTF